MTVELGLIHPPVGMNVFVIKSVVQDVSFTDDLQGRAARSSSPTSSGWPS